MNIKNLSTIIFEKGKKAGLEDMELHVSKRSTINVNVFKGDVDNFKISDELGLSVRGNSRGKTGYAYTERTDKISLQNLIDQVVSNANHSQFYEPIYASSSKINPKDSLTKKGDKTDLQTKLQLPLNMETKAY